MVALLLDEPLFRADVADMLEMARRAGGFDAAYVTSLDAVVNVVELVAAGDDVDLGWLEGVEVPRQQSLCHHLVAGDLAPVTTEVARHPLLSRVPLAREGAIGTYVGVALRGEAGEARGTVCGISREPVAVVADEALDLLRFVARVIEQRLHVGVG